MQKCTMNAPTLKEIEVKYFRLLQKQYAEGMVRYLEGLDQWLMETRDKARYRMQDIRRVSLSTFFGEVTFSRRLYKDRETNQYTFLLDQVLQFDGQQSISPHLEEFAVELASVGPSYRASAKTIESFLGYPALSHETIRDRLISRAESLTYPSEAQRAAKVLFIEVDGLYTKLQRRKQRGMEHRMAVIHEGWEKQGHRVRLRHKRHYLHTGSGSFWEGFGDFLVEHYDVDEQTWLVVNGDGASWIGECCSYFHRCIYTLDRFHILREMRSFLRDRPLTWKALRQALKTQDLPSLFHLLEQIPHEWIDEERREGWARFKAFLYHHREHLKDYRIQLREAGVDTTGMRRMGSAESQMRVMAKRTKRGGYSWSPRGVRAMLQSIMARTEGRRWGEQAPDDSDVEQLSLVTPPFLLRQLLKETKQTTQGHIDGVMRYLRSAQQNSPLGMALKGLRGY